jgi:small subunit ribosomal protein S13
MKNIKNKKEKNQILLFYLTSYYGIGLLSSKLICKILGYDNNLRVKDLSEEDRNKLDSIIKMKFKFNLNEEVKKDVFDNIQRLKDIKCYRGIRHFYGLPANNRRTRTNAKTRS